jgi:hypothetical protein
VLRQYGLPTVSIGGKNRYFVLPIDRQWEIDRHTYTQLQLDYSIADRIISHRRLVPIADDPFAIVLTQPKILTLRM